MSGDERRGGPPELGARRRPPGRSAAPKPLHLPHLGRELVHQRVGRLGTIPKRKLGDDELHPAPWWHTTLVGLLTSPKLLPAQHSGHGSSL